MVDVAVVLQVAPRARADGNVAAVPTLVVHVVQAVHLQPPVLQVVAEDEGHPPVGPLVVAAHRRREDEQLRPGVAVDEEVHRLAVEGRAVPAVVFRVH